MAIGGHAAQLLISLTGVNHGLVPERGKGATRRLQIEIAFREVRFFLLNYHKSPPGIRNRQIMVCLIYGGGMLITM